MLGWAPWGVLGVGLLFGAIGVSSVVKDRQRRQTWRSYPGRVVGSRLDDGQTRSQISYLRDGREIVFWNRITSTTIGDTVGREVEVLVNPDDPNDAVVGRGLVGGGALGLIFIAFGALAVVVGILLFGVSSLALKR